MPLHSPRFVNNTRLQNAAVNNPVMKKNEQGFAVKIVQQSLIDLKYPMPISTKKAGKPDGIYGEETVATVKKFQMAYKLSPDGIVGRNTLEKLDALMSGAKPLPEEKLTGVNYTVPGMKVALDQPSPMSCWATVYTMMISWKDQASYDIGEAVLRVGQKWKDYYDKSYPPTKQGLPSNEFAPFLAAANMTHQPMMNLTIQAWCDLLKHYGLLWIGASVTINPNTGLHSRILEGMIGDGSPGGTKMKIIDPDGGKQYNETFEVFLAKYEAGIMSVSGDYFQIRHFK